MVMTNPIGINVSLLITVCFSIASHPKVYKKVNFYFTLNLCIYLCTLRVESVNNHQPMTLNDKGVAMFFRRRGNKIQCLRAIFNKETLKQNQKMVFAFSVNVTGLGGIDPIELKKLNEDESHQLELFFDKDAKMIEDTIESIHSLSTSMRKEYFDRSIDFSRLRSALDILRNSLRAV